MTAHRRRSTPVAVAVLALLALLAACSDGGTDEGDGDGDPAATSSTTTTEIVLEVDVPGPVQPGSITGIIPRPASVEARTATFPLLEGTAVVIEDGAEAATDAIELLRESVGSSLGLDLHEQEPDAARSTEAGVIVFRMMDTGPAELAAEAYEIEVSASAITIGAADHDGFIWAVQTLRQMLPAAAHGTEPIEGTVVLPGVAIIDAPHHSWRGTMLDIVRHWFGPEDIKTHIDAISLYKINRLHLHLSDDQGWRIEIRSHPKLTEIGSTNEVGGGPGGYLTQDDYRSIITYAAARGITIVPEIDVPGHTNAALVAMPELGCDGKDYEPYTGTQVGFSTLCTDDEAVYDWFDDVIGELAEMTPGEWIHLGGDESHSTTPEDYRRFVERALGIVRDNGKTPIGWDEIGAVDLGGPTVIQHWRDADDTLSGVAGGAQVIMSPSARTYIDMKHEEGGPGNSWAGIIPAEVAYDWDPSAEVPGLEPGTVLGVEAPLWTELISDLPTVQARILPRIPAIAEVGWVAYADRDWDDAARRISTHAARWDAAGWFWTRDPTIPWP